MELEKTNKNGQTVVVVKGRLDTTTAPDLDKGLSEVTDDLVLDFSNLEYISSAGLRVLLSVQKRIMKTGNAMVVRNANAQVKEVFSITGFADILTIE